MSFLAIDEIRGKTSGTPTDVNDLKYQLATAWVNFDGRNTVAIRDSYNVSSITDNGVGAYTVNFATAMDNANYTPSPAVSDEFSVNSGAMINNVSVSGFGIRARSFSANVNGDMDYVVVPVFGGKN